MTTTVKCDRCGKLMARPVLKVGDFSVCETTHRYDEMRYDRMLDLCEKCRASLRGWMEEGE